jgi:hypothetical protein
LSCMRLGAFKVLVCRLYSDKRSSGLAQSRAARRMCNTRT